MLRMDDVTKRLGGRTVIDGLHLTVESGATMALIGPSGCGKSTALRLLIGLLWPDGGRITFADTPVRPDTVARVRERTGYVIQDGGLFPHLTARDNITLKAGMRGWTPERREQRLAELTDLTNFPGDGLDRFPAELSGGQRQRVALMRGLMLDPDVLLMDEPLGALDPMIRFQLQEDLRMIFRRLGKTVVLVTHDLAEAAYFANRIALMRDGHIVQSGSFRELVEEPAVPFVTEFVTAQRGHALAEAGE